MIKLGVAYDQDLEKGIHDLEEILYRLDSRVKNVEWLKENAPADTPARIKEAIAENFPHPKAVPPPPAPPAEPEPVMLAPVPPPAPAVIPPPIKPAPVVEAAPQPKPQPAPAIKPVKKPFVINKTAVIVLCAGLAVAAVAYQLTLNSASHRYAAAGELVKNARGAEAVGAYSKIIAQYPRSIEAAYSQYAIGDIKAQQGDLTAAIQYYEDYLVAAPDNDAKRASALFKIAEIKLKEDMLADADYLFQNKAVQASDYASRAADRVNQIKAVKARLAEANKLMARSPGKAVEAYTAVVAEHPKYAPALTGLEEARKALAAANARPARRRAPAAKPRRR